MALGNSIPDSGSHDVLIVGGGPAGLAAALALARARRSVLVIDAGEPRNAAATHVHNYLSRHGMSPTDLLAVGRAEVTAHGGRILTGTAGSARRVAGAGFEVSLVDGSTVHGRRLLVATGLVDELPEIPGLAQRWGRDVLHCPHCHGWEVRDQAVVIAASGALGVGEALLWRQWSANLTMVLSAAPWPDGDDLEKLAARGIALVEERISALQIDQDRLTGLRLADGTTIACQALVVGPRLTARSELLTGLGLDPTEQHENGQLVGSYIPGDDCGATAVPGVWVAGNITELTDQVIGATAAGVSAASAINADLVEEDTARAVADYRRAQARDRFQPGVGNLAPGG